MPYEEERTNAHPHNLNYVSYEALKTTVSYRTISRVNLEHTSIIRTGDQTVVMGTETVAETLNFSSELTLHHSLTVERERERHSKMLEFAQNWCRIIPWKLRQKVSGKLNVYSELTRQNFLMTEKETVSETLDICSELSWHYSLMVQTEVSRNVGIGAVLFSSFRNLHHLFPINSKTFPCDNIGDSLQNVGFLLLTDVIVRPTRFYRE